jgi:solute carrier family 25 protein 44
MSTSGTPSARFAASSGDAPPASWPPRVARPRRPLDAPSRFAFAASAAEAPSTSGGAQGGGSHPRPPGDVDFDNLDKTKFFLGGAALFSGVTTCLYPLTVIKTRQMVGDGLKKNGAFAVAKEVIKTKGVAGLYRGFGTVVVGTVPIRAVYLSVLEITKARARDACVALDLPPMAHGLADAAGGAVASSCSQILGVPVDVLSQRQMVQGVSVRARDGTGGTKELIGYRNGAHALKETLRKEGVRGLYRGFGASVMTLVPSSALWWGAYGTYQRAIWAAVPSRMGGEYATSGESEKSEKSHPPRRVPAESTVIGVQILSGVCAGMTSGFLTTPLDIVKTRLQVLSGQPGGEAHTFGGTARALYAEHGASGFLRGVRPRMTSVSIWGTTMVTAYEFLKRLASVDDRHE